MDTVSPQNRSDNMRRIRSRDTKPELLVRSLVHRLGFRFRLHRDGLPGKPDIVFVSRRRVIFVNGCFWHQHRGCIDGRLPKSRRHYWMPKLKRNAQRDRERIAALKQLGWKTLVIWDCQTKNEGRLTATLLNFLSL